MNRTSTIALVTGATSGLGKATALALAQAGATVMLVGRNATKTHATIDEIAAATGNRHLIPLVADLTAQSAVRALAASVSERYNRVDLLINNAGGGFANYTESVDGVEMTWALNYLSTFLLTRLLTDALHASRDARVINVTSSSHRGSRLDFDDPNLRRRYGANRAYGQSKLAQIMFSYDLARRWAGTSVSVQAVDPGPVATNLFTSPSMAATSSLMLRLGARLHRSIARPVEQGAQSIVQLATVPHIVGGSGQYWAKLRASVSSAASRRMDDQRRLWLLSEQMTGLTAAQPVAGRLAVSVQKGDT